MSSCNICRNKPVSMVHKSKGYLRHQMELVPGEQAEGSAHVAVAFSSLACLSHPKWHLVWVWWAKWLPGSHRLSSHLQAACRRWEGTSRLNPLPREAADGESRLGLRLGTTEEWKNPGLHNTYQWPVVRDLVMSGHRHSSQITYVKHECISLWAREGSPGYL
jgi:hypothetical protein